MVRTLILTSLLSFLGSALLTAQSIATPFGKNRVQYHNDQYNWTRYETENFMTYWYGKSRNVAQTVIQIAEVDHEDIQRTLEHTLSEKIEIIVYTDISDLKQSNIGDEEAFNSANDFTVIRGDKMLVYFNGDHHHLRRQIRRGIANIYLNSVLYGTNLQEIVQNALLLNLDAWFTEGVVAYAGSDWDHEIDDELRDLLSKEKYRDFEKMADDHPRVAGQSMWKFIEHSFGSATIANVIYLTRISRNLENSFLFVTGVEFDVLEQNWLTFYINRYALEIDKLTATDDLNQLKLKNKKGVPISMYRISPDGDYMAYVVNDRGRTKVINRNLATGEEQTLMKMGTKNFFQETDFYYPLIAWHPSYPELSILHEHRDVVKLRVIDIKNDSYEETDFTTNFQRVYSLDYLKNEEYIVSASTDGYTDLYHYKAENRHHSRITHDFYDDLDASVITHEGQPAILFRSNRTSTSLATTKLDTILPLEKYDLFMLEGIDKSAQLTQLTFTFDHDELQPFQDSPNSVVYLSEKSGIINAYRLDLDTGLSSTLTNLERNIIHHHVSQGSDAHVYNFYHQGNYKNFMQPVAKIGVSPHLTVHGSETKAEGSGVNIPFLPEEKKDVTFAEGMLFQSEYEDPADLQPLDDVQTRTTNSLFDRYFKDYFSESFFEGKPVVKFNPMRSSATRERFRLDRFISRIDNQVLFEGLESYTGEDKELGNVPVGFLLQADIKDLFEDYAISVGLRIPTTFDGLEYFTTIDDNLGLWDKRYAFYRRTSSDISDETTIPARRNKRHTFLGLYRLKYPFDVYQSLRFTTSLRFDKFVSPVTDLFTFEQPFINEKRVSLKVEYVLDNAHDVSINIKNGTRAKLFVEGINEFDLEIKDGFEFDLSRAVTGIVGFDARHYIPIFKRAVLALRGTGATSFGSRRVVYFLGGVEGWILNSSEDDIPVPAGDGFAYKVLAPHLRGFRNNIRNGTSYLLTNTEFRFPLGQFIGFERSRFAFFRNLQVIGFFDAGLAWFGVIPDNEDSPLNTVIVSSPPDNPNITVEARYFRDPTVYGYGFGIRSTMLGYFVKLDYAWGVETGLQRDPRLYLSLGMDF